MNPTLLQHDWNFVRTIKANSSTKLAFNLFITLFTAAKEVMGELTFVF